MNTLAVDRCTTTLTPCPAPAPLQTPSCGALLPQGAARCAGTAASPGTPHAQTLAKHRCNITLTHSAAPPLLQTPLCEALHLVLDTCPEELPAALPLLLPLATTTGAARMYVVRCWGLVKECLAEPLVQGRRWGGL